MKDTHRRMLWADKWEKVPSHVSGLKLGHHCGQCCCLRVTMANGTVFIEGRINIRFVLGCFSEYLSLMYSSIRTDLLLMDLNSFSPWSLSNQCVGISQCVPWKIRHNMILPVLMEARVAKYMLTKAWSSPVLLTASQTSLALGKETVEKEMKVFQWRLVKIASGSFNAPREGLNCNSCCINKVLYCIFYHCWVNFWWL